MKNPTPLSALRAARAQPRSAHPIAMFRRNLGGSALAPAAALRPRTLPYLPRSNLPCSIVRVPFAHGFPPHPSGLPEAGRVSSVLSSLGVPAPCPARFCPVEPKKIPSPPQKQTEPERQGQAGAGALLFWGFCEEEMPGMVLGRGREGSWGGTERSLGLCRDPIGVG